MWRTLSAQDYGNQAHERRFASRRARVQPAYSDGRVKLNSFDSLPSAARTCRRTVWPAAIRLLPFLAISRRRGFSSSLSVAFYSPVTRIMLPVTAIFKILSCICEQDMPFSSPQAECCR